MSSLASIDFDEAGRASHLDSELASQQLTRIGARCAGQPGAIRCGKQHCWKAKLRCEREPSGDDGQTLWRVWLTPPAALALSGIGALRI